jgi:cysteine desulfurase
MSVYLDNAATTKVDPKVMEAMLPFLSGTYGNPSSIHSFGRESKAAIEKSRKKVAELLNTSPSSIFFTSGGTEADNFAIIRSIQQFGIKKAITSPLEHHAVLHTLEYLHKSGEVELEILEVDSKGNLNHDQLKKSLESGPQTFVSLMQGNNEIGTLNPVLEISDLVKAHKGIFHSDTVQTVGHYKHDLSSWKIDFMVGAGHKFHGPKGIGFIYVSPDVKISPLIHGGAQERNMRGGTENISGIVGLATALDIAYSEMEPHRSHIEGLKSLMISRLKAGIPDVQFNGESESLQKSLYTVLNVSTPPSEMNEMLIFNLDINKICASGGSACSSGSELGSHVLRGIQADPNRGAVRFSFGKYNTVEDIEYAAQILTKMYAQKELVLQ